MVRRNQQSGSKAAWKHPRDLPRGEFLKLFGRWVQVKGPVEGDKEEDGEAQWAQAETPAQADERPSQCNSPRAEPQHPPPEGGSASEQPMQQEGEAPPSLPVRKEKEPNPVQEQEPLLSKSQWRVEERSPDGHCLYHALLGNDDIGSMKVLRARIALWLDAAQRATFGDWKLQNWILASAGRAELTQNGNPQQRDLAAQEYIQEVKNSGLGGALEIFAFTQATGIGVKVYQETPQGYKLIHYALGTRVDEPRRLLRGPKGSGHYNELKRRVLAQRQKEAEEDIDCRNEVSLDPEVSPSETQDKEGPPKSTSRCSRGKRQREEAQYDDDAAPPPPRKDGVSGRAWNIDKFRSCVGSKYIRRRLRCSTAAQKPAES